MRRVKTRAKRSVRPALRFSLVLLTALASPAFSQDSKEEFVEALRVRRLDRLADEYVQRTLANPHISDAVKIPVAVQYSTLLATQAGEASDTGDRERLWDRATETLRRLIDETDDEGTVFSLRFQSALLDYTRGDWLNQWAELAHGDQESTAAARTYLASAIETLAELTAEAERSILQPETTSSALDIGREERRRLLAALRQRLGSARLALARTYPPRDPRQADQLRESISAFRLVDLDLIDDPFAAGTELIEAYRLSQRFAEADETVEKLQRFAATQTQKDELVAEQTDNLLAQKRLLDALAVLFPRLQERSDRPARWEYLYLKALLSQADAMRDEPEKASKLQASALMQLHRLEGKKAGLWVRRAERELSRHSSSLLGEDAKELRAAAEVLQRAEKHASAAEVFEKAARLCLSADTPDDAYPLLHEAARSWERAGQPLKAADAFDQTLKIAPHNDAAPAASLRVISNLRTHRQSDPNERLERRLESAIARHLETYGDHETAGEAYAIRGLLEKDRGRFAEAIAAFDSVPHGHRLRATATVQASRAYQAWVRPMSHQSTEPIDSALQFHKAQLESDALTEEQSAELAVRYAKFLLDPRKGSPEDAEAVLQTALEHASNDQKAAAWRLLVIAFLEQGKISQAEATIDDQQDLSAEKLFELVRFLNEQLLYYEENRQRQAGYLARRALGILDRKQRDLPPALVLELRYERALALIFVGGDPHLQEASELLDLLRRERPRDARLLEATALLLMQSRRYEAAIAQWKTLLRGIAKDSPMWYRGRLNLLISQRRAGQRDEAKKTLELMEVLHPSMGGPGLAPRFAAEKQRLQ